MPVTAVAQEASRSPERPSVRATRDPAGSRAQAWLFVVVFFCVVSGIDFLYWVAEVEASAGHRLLLQGLAMIVFWKLLQVECRPYRVSYPLDMGFFLCATSFLVLPYYLWCTQRWRGLGKSLLVVALWATSLVAWRLVAWLLVET